MDSARLFCEQSRLVALRFLFLFWSHFLFLSLAGIIIIIVISSSSLSSPSVPVRQVLSIPAISCDIPLSHIFRHLLSPAGLYIMLTLSVYLCVSVCIVGRKGGREAEREREREGGRCACMICRVNEERDGWIVRRQIARSIRKGHRSNSPLPYNHQPRIRKTALSLARNVQCQRRFITNRGWGRGAS